jgi:hypothetical protein
MAGTLKRIIVVIFLENSGSLDKCDGLEYEGRNWLVPLWLAPLGVEWQEPERIIPLDRFRHQKTDAAGIDYTVNVPIPRAIWSGPTSPELLKQYGVILSPPIRIATKKNLH